MLGLCKSLLGVLLLCACCFAGQKGSYASSGEYFEKISASLKLAEGFLLKAGQSGNWDDTHQGFSYEFGPSGRKALCVWALLEGDFPVDDQLLGGAVDQLISTENNSVRFKALRLLALTALGRQCGEKQFDQINADTAWLVERISPDGAYGVSADDQLNDNFSSFLAHRAVLSADRFFENYSYLAAEGQSGYEIPDSYWRVMRNYWQLSQLADGGWGFAGDSTESYGSITASALSVIAAGADRLDNGRAIARAGESEYFSRGLSWLGGNFSPWNNPELGPQYYYRWIWAMGLLGTESGLVTLDGRDYRSEFTRRLLKTQLPDGSWGDLADTAMAVIYLRGMSLPVLFGKLQYDGAWNSRRSDLAQLTRWLGSSFERQLRWRVVDVDSYLKYWRDTPVLLISGASRPVFNDSQLERLRQYVLRGGLIVSVAVGDSASFNVEMIKIYRKLFPRWQLEDIDQNNPIFNAYKKLDKQLRVKGVSNGARLLAIHCPQDISKYWHADFAKSDLTSRMFAANIYLHASDFGAFDAATDAIDVSDPAKLDSSKAAALAGVIKIAVVSPTGEKFCEPFALERLKRKLLEDNYLAEITDGRTFEQLADTKCDLAIVCSQGDFELAPDGRQALLNYIDSGGFVLLTAAAAGKDFDAAIKREIIDGALGEFSPRLAQLENQSEILFRAGMEIEKVSYRRAAALIYGQDRTPRLMSLSVDGKMLGIYSRDDLLVSLTGFKGQAIRGFKSDDAYKLLRNIAIYAAGREKSSLPVLPKRIHVKWGQ